MDSTALCEPLSADAPCGVDLEDTQLLASFDAFRLFGNTLPLRAELDWRDIREQALAALAQSRDLRLLAHLAAASLRIEGLSAFCALLPVADRWLTEQWDAVYPRVDEDAVLRKNALSCFADRMAVVDALRRAPIAAHRQLGLFSLRDLELATGQLAPTDSDTDVLDLARIEATLTGSPVAELAALAADLAAASAALKNIAGTMQARAGFQSAPDFEPLSRPLARIHALLTEHLGTREVESAAAPEQAPPESGVPNGGRAAVAGVGVGEIGSRQDAIRALDAVCAFFRKNEPSSPVPLLLERAKRLVSKSFLEVLEDIAPESLSQVKALGGIRDDNQ